MKNKSDFFSLLDSTGGVINGETSKDRIASYIVGTGEYVSQYGLPIKVGGVKQWIQDWRNDNRGVGQKVGQVDQVKVARSSGGIDPSIRILDEDLELPEGITEFIEPYILKGKRKILVINDVHAPYHNLQSLRLAINYGREEKVDTVLLNGDILDFLKLSKFTHNPSRPDFEHEIEIGIQFLQQLRKLFPSEKIIYKEGNHEKRLGDYIFRNAPALFGIEALQLNELLKLRELNIDYVINDQYIIAGKLTIIHGNEMKAGGIHVARSIRMKANENILFGHHHRVQSDTVVSIHGDVQGSWAVGCLCDLRPAYLPYNQWLHGFAIVHLNEDGTFVVSNKKIIKGVIY